VSRRARTANLRTRKRGQSELIEKSRKIVVQFTVQSHSHKKHPAEESREDRGRLKKPERKEFGSQIDLFVSLVHLFGSELTEVRQALGATVDDKPYG